jgi:hypothetical protein
MIARIGALASRGATVSMTRRHGLRRDDCLSQRSIQYHACSTSTN